MSITVLDEIRKRQIKKYVLIISLQRSAKTLMTELLSPNKNILVKTYDTSREAVIDLSTRTFDEKHRFCIIIYDYVKTNDEGIEAIKRLRKISWFKTVPIVVTALEDDINDLQKDDLGLIKILIKPINLLALQTQLNDLLVA